METWIRPDMVAEGLWVGSAPRTIEDFALLQSLGITDVVTLQTEEEALNHGLHPTVAFGLALEHGMSLHRNPIIDFDRNSLLHGVPAARDVIASLLQRGRSVYVHCAAGMNRSPTVAAAVLAADGTLSPEHACRELVRRHPSQPDEGVVRFVTTGKLR
jgi:atypical dual specificity phosphatase